MNLTADEVQKMKVVELRAELAARNLDNRGVKAVLTERLLAALEQSTGEDGGVSNSSGLVGNGASSSAAVSETDEVAVPVPASSSPVKSPVPSSPPAQVQSASPVKVSPAAPVITTSSPVKPTTSESPVKAEVESKAPAAAVTESPSTVQSESSQEEEEEKKLLEEAPEEEDEGDEETADIIKKEEEQPAGEGDEEAADNNEEKEAGDESMEVEEGSNKRKLEGVNGEGEGAEGEEATPEKKRPKKEVEVKIIPEHEPEFDENQVLLDWFKSDLNLTISEENFLEATPWTIEEFPFAYAGVKATYGFNKGKLYYEVKWEDSLDVKLDFGEEEKKYVLRVGWSDLSAGLQLGQEKLSYCWDSAGKVYKGGEAEDFEVTFDKDDVVGTSLNLDSDPVELKFTKNGEVVGKTIEIPKEELQDKTLFPHVLSRNVKFTANFGESDTSFTPEEGYTLVSKVDAEDRVRGPARAETKAECEFVLLCGLAGCGKTKWSKDYVANNVEKHYNILGTSILVERSLQNQQILGSSSTSRTYDGFFQKAGKFVEKLIEIAPSRRRNYILDQSNVVAGAQRRKSSGFQGFIRRAIVIVPSDEEYQNRIKAKEQEQGKSVPKSTILDMKAGFRLPEVGEIFSAVDFADLDKEEAQKLISKYNKEGQNAGFGRPIPSRGGGVGRFRGGRGGRGYGRGGGGGGWRGRGGPMGPRGGPHFGGPRGGRGGMPPMRGGPRGGPPRGGGGGGPPRGGPNRGGGPPRGGPRGNGGPGGRGGGGNWRSPGGPRQFQGQGGRVKRDSGGRGGGSWRGGNGNVVQTRGGYGGPGGGRVPQAQGPPFQNWGQQWGPPGGRAGYGGGGFTGDPWQQVPDQGFGQSWDSSGTAGRGAGGGTWQGYGGQTFGYGGSGGGRR